MNALLQEHGAKRIFPMPQGLKELCSDITREVLRKQPENLYRFIADYTHAILVTREKAREAAVIVHDLLFSDLTYEKMLSRRGINMEVAHHAATIIQAAYRGYRTRRAYVKLKPPPPVFDLRLHLEELGVELEEAELHALKIQSLYRGWKVRQVMWEVFGFHTGGHDLDESRELLQAYLSSLGISYSMATKAAGCIQKFYRDYRKRNSNPLVDDGSSSDAQKKSRSRYGSDSSDEEVDVRHQNKVAEVVDETLEMELPIVLPQDEHEEEVAVVEREGEDDVEKEAVVEEDETAVVQDKDEQLDVDERLSTDTREVDEEFSEYKTETDEGSTVTDWTDGNPTDVETSDVEASDVETSDVEGNAEG